MKRGIAIAMGLLGLVLQGCGDQRVVGGNTSETPNTVTGVLFDTTGRPRIGDTVILRPARWIASEDSGSEALSTKIRRTVTDSGGAWSVVGLESGAWVVECRSGVLGRLSAAVTVGEERSHLARLSDTIYPRGRIRGSFAAGMFPRGARASVAIYGTAIRSSVDSTGTFVLENVPSGPMRLVAHVETDSSQSRAEDALELPPRDSLAPRVLLPSSFEGEDYDLWPGRKSGFLRFSGIGGFVLESDIDEWPILVRLRGEMVSPLDRTGSSLRFADGGGTHLRYEIERWDPVLGEADVWVRMRHTAKRSDLHGIVVYWGLPEVPDWSDGAAVFDTADGWVGVWHFSGSDPLKDVTANGLRLVSTGTESVQGLVADGIQMSPGSRLEVPAGQLTTSGAAMVSAWVSVDSASTGGIVAALTNSVAADSFAWILRVGGDPTGALRTTFQTWARRDSMFPKGLTKPIPSRTWTHLGAMLESNRDRPRTRMLVDSSMSATQQFDSVTLAADRAVLRAGGGWLGNLDELRVRRWTRHPDALRLDWGTGRREATVVWWGN